MYNSFSLKKVLELYAAMPLILIALAGTYKFGYFSTFDALWVLPSINDANSAINNNTLPIVLFEQQTAYPNDQSDWRLLAVIDTRFVLINLKNKTDYGYEMKVVEYSKVDSIY